MLIALLPILLIICAILLLSYLWERRKCLRMQKRLFRESRKLEHTNHIASAILKNVHAYILLIDNDFKVLKTNYYQLTGTQKGLEEKRVGDLLQCRNALSAEGGCGTHAYCGSCPIRCAIRQAFEQRRGFTDLEATLNVLTSEKKSVECDAVISGSYFLLNEEENMVLTVHDITQLKETEKQLTLAKEKKTMDEGQYLAIVKELGHIPDKMKEVLKLNDRIAELSKIFTYAHNFIYLGRGYSYPVALEGALKLKEISYIPAAEMKHGPIALVDAEMPVVVIATRNGLYEKVLSNIQEIKARKGRVIAIVTKGDTVISKIADTCIELPETMECLDPLITTVPLQLLAYHIAVCKGMDVDQPRNLAKSVTVE